MAILSEGLHAVFLWFWVWVVGCGSSAGMWLSPFFLVSANLSFLCCCSLVSSHSWIFLLLFFLPAPFLLLPWSPLILLSQFNVPATAGLDNSQGDGCQAPILVCGGFGLSLFLFCRCCRFVVCCF